MTEFAAAEPAHDGQVRAAISTAIVRLLREDTGRGATKARTVYQEDVVLVLLEEVLTRAEAHLVERGQAASVLDLRATIQSSMRDEMVEVSERLTGRTVRAFMSTNHIDPDLAAEIFVLEPLPDGMAAAHS